MQARSIISITKILVSLCEAKNNLLATGYRISNAKATSVEISNIK